jgi:arylsulfatase A-like enzyme
MILQSLKNNKIKNIFIFVCDSLRWDYTPRYILDQGISIKTIASSLYTAPSFPSIISGLYPTKTGVYNWQNKINPLLHGILNINKFNHSLWCETTWPEVPPWESHLHNVLGNPKGIHLQKIPEPFVYIEDDKGGHCPHNIPFDKYGSFHEYYRDIGKKGIHELRKQYKNGINSSAKRFEKRIEILKERKLLDQTLIVFTSDHGELLGEYGGLVDHGRPACPELIYVPTIFIHPSLTPQIINNKIIRHVDLCPTIYSILQKQLPYKSDGIDLTKDSFPNVGLNYRIGGYYNSKTFYDKLLNYEIMSIWDEKGGHVFQKSNKFWSGFIHFYNLFLQRKTNYSFFQENLKHNSKNKLNDIAKIIQTLDKSHIKYGNPEINKSQAEEIIYDQQKPIQEFKEKIKIKNSLKHIKNLS